uniref:Minor tail protein Z n=1 Tax=Caudovirales sp. ctkvU4 TaxID=2826783 RepID=A0A8S5QRE5_9CAUD|nr:MAG TPA: minor tail protein Z [Caudovirales sp. ctkvU4]
MITIDGSELLKAEKFLKNIPNGIEKAVKRSVSEAAKGVKVDMARAASKNYNVTVAKAKSTVSIAKGSDAMKAIVASKGRPIALKNFNPKPGHVQYKGRRNRPVTVTIKKKNKKVVKGGFVASMDTGHIGVMKRLGQSRLPIKELYGPSVPQMINSEEVRNEIEEKAKARLAKSFAHNADRILKGYGR